MPELAVDATKFAGMSAEQAATFPRRTVVGEPLTRRRSRRHAEDDLHRRACHGAGGIVDRTAKAAAGIAAARAVPQFAPGRDRPASATARPGHGRRRRRDPVSKLWHGALWHRRHRDPAGSVQAVQRLGARLLQGRSQAFVCVAARLGLRHPGRHQGNASRPAHGAEGRDGLAGARSAPAFHLRALRAALGRVRRGEAARDLPHPHRSFVHQDGPEGRRAGSQGRRRTRRRTIRRTRFSISSSPAPSIVIPT